MAYISKMVSCNEVIAKISRVFKPQGSSWIKESIEDIGWAIQGIGYHMGFEKQSTPYPYLRVRNHRVEIPCNVQRIIAVEMLCPHSNSKNILNPDGTTPFPQDEDLKCNNFKSVKLPLGSDTTSYGLVDSNSPRTTQISPNAPYYNVNPDFIVTSFCDGIIKLHTVSFSVDSNGYPRIVDDFDYKTAIEWYLVAQMILKGYKHPEVSYKDAIGYWEIHRLRAENAGKLLSLDGADRFNAGWSRYVQNAAIAGDFFMNNEQTVFISQN